MDITIFLSAFSLLALVYFFIGFYASKKIHNTTDYFLAGRNLGFFAVTFTLIATQLGGGFFVGMSEDAYKMGYFGIFYALSMTIGFLLLSCGFASKMQALGVATTAEIFQTKYKSIFLKKAASLLSIATMSGLLIGQIVASKELFKYALGAGSFMQVFFIFFWIFIIAYTIAGGLKAVVIADTFQVALILLFSWGVFIYALFTTNSSWFLQKAIETQQTFFSISHQDLLVLLPTLIMPALFSLIEQDLAQRFFAAKSKKVATLSAFAAGITLMGCSLIPVYFGMMTKIQGLPLLKGSSPLLYSIAAVTNNIVAALIFCALIAAITSTADSLLCAISSNVAQDFNFSWTKIKNKLQLSKIVTCITGVTAFALSYFFSQNVIKILEESYAISVSALFVPLLFAYFKKDLSKKAAYLSVSLGFSAFLYFRIFPILGSSIIILGLSLMGYIVGALLDKKSTISF
jgi:solute:Na+ symporter, SSS family